MSRTKMDEINRMWEIEREAKNKKWKSIVASDKAAKKKGSLVGRYIQESYADGYSFYLITKETRSSVTIEVVTGIGDDWVLPMFGRKTTVKKSYAKRNVEMRDSLAELLGEEE